MPRWLAERFVARHGEAEAEQWLAALNTEPAGLSLRVNTLRTTAAELGAALAAADVTVTQAPLGAHALVLPEPPPPRDLPGYGQGWFYVQDLV